MNDLKKFCLKCNWYDNDLGCTSDYNERYYQCNMFIFYHPKEVKEFYKDFDKYFRGKK